MKFSLIIVSLFCFLSTAFAKSARALLIYDEVKFERVFLVAASATNLQYKTSETATNSKRISRSKVKNVFFSEPRLYAAAVRSFRFEKYEEAMKQFEQVAQDYKLLSALPNNYSTLASFKVMECLRNLGRYKELEKARESFQSEGLVRSTDLAQLELYRIWALVANESWKALDNSASQEVFKTSLGPHRAQVAYCTGLAQMNTDKAILALNSFAVAMTADAGGSKALARQAAYKSLDIYLKDEQTVTALKLEAEASEDYNPKSLGAIRLTEAGGIITIYEKSFGLNHPLQAKYKVFRKFAPEIQ